MKQKEYVHEVMKDPAGFFRDGERDAIYSSCKNDRDRLLIRLLWKTGRRVGEILKLKVEHINFDENEILWFIEKKGKDHLRWKPSDKQTMVLLKKYVEDNKLIPESFVFQSDQREGHISRQRVFQIVRDCCKASGIHFIGSKRPHPHHFRHSFAVDKARKLKSPADIRKLQQYLEHSTIGMTEQYLQFGNEEMRSLVEDDD